MIPNSKAFNGKSFYECDGKIIYRWHKILRLGDYQINIRDKERNVMAKNILICDDAAFMRMMIKDILTKNGYNVAGEAENGLKAVEKYNETKPDLVMMDITMPEMDGIQALKKIKETDPNATVIMCSAMGQQAMVIEAIQSGAKDFIVKPFQADRVLEAIKKVVG